MAKRVVYLGGGSAAQIGMQLALVQKLDTEDAANILRPLMPSERDLPPPLTTLFERRLEFIRTEREKGNEILVVCASSSLDDLRAQLDIDNRLILVPFDDQSSKKGTIEWTPEASRFIDDIKKEAKISAVSPPPQRFT